MTIEQIKSQEDLKKFLQEQDKRLDELTGKAWADRHLGSETTASGAPVISEKAGENFKAFLKGAVAKNLSATTAAGYHSIASAELETKTSPVGTPLYSDAVTGSYNVPVEFLAQVQYFQDSASVIAPLCQHTVMNSRTKSVPTESTALTATWVIAQSSGATESTPTFGESTLTAYALAAWTGFSEEMLDDSGADLMQFFSRRFGEKFASLIDLQILQGTGSPFTGILGANGTVTTSMGAGQTTFDSVSYTDLINVVSGLSTQNLRRGARWFMSPPVMDTLRGLQDAMGRPYLMEPTGPAVPAMLLGYPVSVSDQMPTASAVSTKFIAFGSPQQTIIVGDRRSLGVKLYDSTYYSATALQLFLRAYQRIAVQLVLPAGWSLLKTSAS